jgi:hypothetical protein
VKILLSAIGLFLPLALVTGCNKPAAMSSGPHKHEHHPPHGGVPVVLGDEVYHVELVLDAATGTLQAYIFDGELENFIRSSVPSIRIDATVNGAPQTLVLNAVANPATGETVGDTSLFETRADWLKSAREFDASLKSITVRGTTFTDVKFNYPKGNDTD